MGEPKFIETPSGDEIVILLRADYDALVAAAADAEEDAADLALYEERKADFQAGTHPVLPAAVSDALMQGDSLPKALRNWRGMTLETLAQRSGMPITALEAWEKRQDIGRPDLLASVAVALDVDPAWLAL